MDPGKAEVGMETVLHSHEDTGKKASGEKKKGREKGKVERSSSVRAISLALIICAVNDHLKITKNTITKCEPNQT